MEGLEEDKAKTDQRLTTAEIDADTKQRALDQAVADEAAAREAAERADKLAAEGAAKVRKAREMASPLADKYKQSQESTAQAKAHMQKLDTLVGQKMAVLQKSLDDQQREAADADKATDQAFAKSEKAQADYGDLAAKKAQADEAMESQRAGLNAEDKQVEKLSAQATAIEKKAHEMEQNVKELNKKLIPSAKVSQLDSAPNVN